MSFYLIADRDMPTRRFIIESDKQEYAYRVLFEIKESSCEKRADYFSSSLDVVRKYYG